MEQAGGRVVLVGGGYGNMTILKKLLKSKLVSSVTLVEPKESFYHAIGSPRGLVDADFARILFLPFDECWRAGQVKHVRCLVRSVNFESNTVSVTGSDEEISYDVLVLATGRTYASPFRFPTNQVIFEPQQATTSQLLGMLTEQRERLLANPHVVVVGGGSTGVETAGEIKARFPEKDVTLVHSKPRLLNTQIEVSDKAAEIAAEKLRNLGVDVQLNTVFAVNAQHANTFVISAHQSTPNTSFMPKELLDQSSLVKVDGRLNVIGHKNVFAFGDMVSGYPPCIKSTVYQHAPIVTDNVLLFLGGRKLKEIKKLPGLLQTALVVSIGPHDALGTNLLSKVMAGKKTKDFGAAETFKKMRAQQ